MSWRAGRNVRYGSFNVPFLTYRQEKAMHTFRTVSIRSAAAPLSLAALIAFGLSAALRANAQTTIYTNSAAYNDASLQIATLAFDGLAADQNGFQDYGKPGALNVAGVTFTTGADTDLYVIGPGYVDGAGHSFDFPGDGTATLDVEHGSPSVLTATLPAGVSAVGTEIGGFYSSATLTITINGTSTFTYTAPAAHTGLGYVGFIDPSGTISTISISDPSPDSGSTNLVVDNFSYGIDAAPEPSQLAALGLGALCVAGLMLCARKRIAA
jgi:hypothetical protein